MASVRLHSIWRRIKGRCLYLLIAILVLLVFYPIVHDGPHEVVFMMVLNSVVLVAGTYAVSDKPVKVLIAASIAAPQIVITVIAYWLDASNEWKDLAGHAAAILLMIFYVYTISVVAAYVVQGSVTKDKIYGAISIYLLMGLAWASFYAYLGPESFAVAHGTMDPIYYSFTTLTTLGYGDIVPVTPGARSVASLEAVAGVMFLAIAIARLLSLYQREGRASTAKIGRAHV